MATNSSPISPLFGWEFIRKEPETEKPSFSPKEFNDGAVQVTASGFYGTYVDMEGSVRNEAELITRYRDMALHPEIDNAIEEIVNESISIEENNPVKIVLDDINQSDVVKEAVEYCFNECLHLLNFNQNAYDIYRRWYIDGRMYFHVIIDEENTANGIQEVRYIDPRKIRKVREVVKRRPGKGDAVTTIDATVTQTKNEYYIYSDRGFAATGNKIYGGSSQGTTQGLKIAKDSIIYVTSGMTDSVGSMVYSYLHPAIKPLNQLRSLEDAAIIYRLVRSPERRVWYVDVGNMPRMQAEQYMRDIMTKHKNRLVYDAATGEVKDDRKFMTMLEDYWLARRDGKGTEVDTLPPGASFNQIDDIYFFQKKLYMSLHVPIGRLDPDNQYNIGVATEITRDEVKFGKFVARLRNKFSQLFTKMLERQVVLRQIMTVEDFTKIANLIRYEFAKDNFFMEMKENQVMQGRLELLNAMVPFIGKYFSHTAARKLILRQTDEEIKEMESEIIEEMNDPILNPPMMPDPNDPEGNGVMVDPRVANNPPQGQQQRPGRQNPNANPEDSTTPKIQVKKNRVEVEDNRKSHLNHEKIRLKNTKHKDKRQKGKLMSISRKLSKGS